MEPLSSTVATLVAKSLTSGAGPLARLFLSRRRQAAEHYLVEQVRVDSGKLVVSALAELKSKISDYQLTETAKFLRSLDAQTFTHQLAVTILTSGTTPS